MGRPQTKRVWEPAEMVAVRELYETYGVYPPGHKDNIVVKAVAHCLGRTTASIYKRLHNYAAYDPATGVRGLRHCSKSAEYFFMRSKNEGTYKSLLRQARRGLGLQGII